MFSVIVFVRRLVQAAGLGLYAWAIGRVLDRHGRDAAFTFGDRHRRIVNWLARL